MCFSTTINSPAGGFEDPWRDYPGGVPPFPLNRSIPQFQAGAGYYYTENLHSNPPTVQKAFRRTAPRPAQNVPASR